MSWQPPESKQVNEADLKKQRRFVIVACVLWLCIVAALLITANRLSSQPGADPGRAWWLWPITLFVFCFGLGIVAVLAGIGGGALFVPLVGGLFPFHIDFVRGAAIFAGLSGALAAGPGLLKQNYSSIRLALPLAVVSSCSAILGARIGLRLPTSAIEIALGCAVILVAVVMLASRRSEDPDPGEQDFVSLMLGMTGSYWSKDLECVRHWNASRTPVALLLSVVIGLMVGMFGLGAGWANVPVLNLVMNIPLKVAVGASGLMISMTNTSAAWVYLHRGCVIPLIAVPSMLGLMLGARLGAKKLKNMKSETIKKVVVVVLFISGIRMLLRGFGF